MDEEEVDEGSIWKQISNWGEEEEEVENWKEEG